MQGRSMVTCPAQAMAAKCKNETLEEKQQRRLRDAQSKVAKQQNRGAAAEEAERGSGPGIQTPE